jgi:ankyrin repeat protein
VQKTGYRALHLAALKGSRPVVQALLLGGANVDVRAKVSPLALSLSTHSYHAKRPLFQ